MSPIGFVLTLHLLGTFISVPTDSLVLPHSTTPSFFTKALLFDFTGVPSFGIFSLSGIDVHGNHFIIPRAFKGLLGHTLPFVLTGANKGVAPTTKSFSKDAQLAYFTSCEFFPFV